MTATVRTERFDDGIARVILDHEARLNAMTNAMWDQLAEAMATLDADDNVRCVILTGAGTRAFGAGADISEFEENRSSAAKARKYGARLHAALDGVRSCRHPVIAAIRGLCIGGALEVAVCTDMRIAAEGARFGIPAKKLGLVVAYQEMKGLIETVGKSNALRIVLEGDIFGAEDALRMGLVNRIVADEAFDEHIIETAHRIAEGAPLTARWHKKFANRLMEPQPLSPEEEDESFACFDTEDFRIGRRAFLAKAKPTFVGR